MKKRAGVRIKITLLTTGFVFILLVLTMFASNAIIIFAIKHGWITARPEQSIIPVPERNHQHYYRHSHFPFYEPSSPAPSSYADPGNT